MLLRGFSYGTPCQGPETMKRIEICPSCGLEVVTESGRPSRCPRCESPVGDGGPESDALLSLEFDGGVQGVSSYPLPEGVSTIGRRSARSTATVQIAVADGFMSKVHCRVTAQRRGDGSVEAALSDAGSANGTYLNGRSLLPAEEAPLHDGDVVRMGNTELRIMFR